MPEIKKEINSLGKEDTSKNQSETVSKEAFDNLYQQALELDTRYKRLIEAYNTLLELYLSKK